MTLIDELVKALESARRGLINCQIIIADSKSRYKDGDVKMVQNHIDTIDTALAKYRQHEQTEAGDEESLAQLIRDEPEFRIACNGLSDWGTYTDVAKAAIAVLRPFLRQPEPRTEHVSGEAAALALSKAILEAHAKWKAQYLGVAHEDGEPIQTQPHKE